MDLDNLKYSELQKLAKSVGIRANVKIDKLLKALKDHYSSQGGQGRSDDSKHRSDGNETSQSDPSGSSGEAPEENAGDDQVSDQMSKKKTTARGKKKGARKGARGKTKKNSSSEESESKTESSDTPPVRRTSAKKGSQTSTPIVKTPSDVKSVVAKTSQNLTAGVKKTPVIVKPVRDNTPLAALKKTPVIVKPVRGNTPLAALKKTPQLTKSTPGKSTPSLFSLKGSKQLPGPARVKHLPVKKPAGGDCRKDGGGKSTLSAETVTNGKRTPASGGGKRRSPRNTGDGDQVSSRITDVKTGQKRKRKDTFELEEPTLGNTATPEAEATKRARTSAGPQEVKDGNTSPGISGMLDSMTGVTGSAERRNRLMNAINKKVEGKVQAPPAGPTTQIPRFATFLAKKKQEQKKPITPGNKDWEKVHKKAFSKFDSIDVYLEKKRKRAEEMTASVKKSRTVLHEVQEAVTKLKSKRTPSLGKDKVFKPTVMSTKDLNLNFGAMGNKTPKNRSSTAAPKPFKPTVTSTKDMNLNFSSMKTPVTGLARAAGRNSASRTNKVALSARKSVGAGQQSARKSPQPSTARKSIGTPFQFRGNLNMSEAKSTSKQVFDLKASLARPITWKPHVGKLKPLDSGYYAKEAPFVQLAPNRMDIFKSAVNKTRMTYSRQDKRAAAAAKRAENKSNLQMRRRGIVVSP